MFATILELLSSHELFEEISADEQIRVWCLKHVNDFKTADDAYLALRKHVEDDPFLSDYAPRTYGGDELKIQYWLAGILGKVIKKRNLHAKMGDVKLSAEDYSHSRGSGSATASM